MSVRVGAGIPALALAVLVVGGASRVARGALAIATLVGWAVIRPLAEARVDDVRPATAAAWDA